MNSTFIEFLAKNNAIRFGDFTLKSGRASPYFIDLGVLSSGSATSLLGNSYASKIKEIFGDKFDVVFGPAYKAIPLAISTTLALNSMGIDKKWLYDRKEMKLHGADASNVFVGSQNIDIEQRVIILDDVLTTGGTKMEAIQKLEKSLKAQVVGIVIAVDRMERGMRGSAIDEFKDKTGVPVYAIENIHNIFTYLKGRPLEGKTYVDEKMFESYRNYMNKFGVKF